MECEPLEMLQGQGDSETSVHWRRDSLSVQNPEAIPTVLRTVCRVPGQIEVIKNFQEDVVPDSATAYPYLLLYESLLRQYLSTPLDSMPQSKDRFLAYLCTVGRETFSLGRHYWEMGMNLTRDAL
ncbi:E3 Ubiquitin-Protein Ligase Trim17 [Manis pentadactyla]|nr:E3 Ubiquitin-Protein Ligase Trim17 [Manis pentadactyla]